MTLELEVALTKTFTPGQEAFVHHLAAGVDKTLAAELAGYSKDNAQRMANALLQQPAILAAVQIAIAQHLALGAPASVKMLRDFVEDTQVDKRVRLAAAKTILDRAGFIAPKAVALGKAGETPLNEMSMTDLRSLADKLEQEIAGRAKDVSSAKAAPRDTQAIDDII